MTCKWDKKPCRREGCSEWHCAYLKAPEECRFFAAPDGMTSCSGGTISLDKTRINR